MIKIIMPMKRRPGMSVEEFRDYYETKHRVIATTDYTALECSTAHLNDCIRFEDDSDRGSGKIETAHEGN